MSIIVFQANLLLLMEYLNHVSVESHPLSQVYVQVCYTVEEQQYGCALGTPTRIVNLPPRTGTTPDTPAGVLQMLPDVHNDSCTNTRYRQWEVGQGAASFAQWIGFHKAPPCTMSHDQSDLILLKYMSTLCTFFLYYMYLLCTQQG